MDDVAKYHFLRTHSFRAVWSDPAGVAVLSFQVGDPDSAREGSIRVFPACSLPHAPPLLLLGLIKVVYGGYFRPPAPKYLG